VIVRHWMTTSVVTISKEASIQEALALMKQGSIRHLPVVDPEQHLVGWVTDADLRGVLIASMLEELTLEDVMVRKPHKGTPEMPLEEAARLILQKKIGGLPVVEDGKLVGVITVVDILSAFITVLGMLDSSSRVDVKISSSASPLDEITRLVQERQGEVISICHLSAVEGQGKVYSLRLRKCDLKPIVDELKQHGFEVVSSSP
jgi:acetoin utilization protein AcuB